MKFTTKNLNDIPREDAHGGSGQRQVLITPAEMSSPYFEMMTKGYLNPGFSYDWHEHADIDELFIVLKGEGKFMWLEETSEYKEGDIFTIPANTQHKITAEGEIPSEFYFVRLKAK